MKKYIVALIISLFLITSCGEYQKLLKSADTELKFNKAVEYYNNKQYSKAITLFDDVKSYYKGTDKSELVLNYLARAYMAQKDYYSASEYFKTYVKSYPRGEYIQEARFNIAYASYKDSPDVKLDQATTYDAIKAFQDYLDLYPNSQQAPEAEKYLVEMKNKLTQKEYLNAKLYYDLGMYMGNNNYRAAVIAAENALKDNPGTSWREDLMILALQSKYAEANVSSELKRNERYQNVIDESYNYLNEFPQGKFKKEAEKILKEAQHNVEK